LSGVVFCRLFNKIFPIRCGFLPAGNIFQVGDVVFCRCLLIPMSADNCCCIVKIGSVFRYDVLIRSVIPGKVITNMKIFCSTDNVCRRRSVVLSKDYGFPQKIVEKISSFLL
jgi:hypothetical protein